MSQTFSLVCKETRQRLWVGQGWGAMTTFYYADEKVTQRLGRFLEATRGKPLVLLCVDEQGEEFFEGWEEFEEPS